MSQRSEFAIFGGGCFWCTEAIFASLKGVSSVTPGYAGGRAEHPTYEQVCSGTTGHAEVVRIEFDPAVITFRDLLEVFFTLHDPTTRNQQGNDVGEQCRSVILCTSEQQLREAQRYIAEVTAAQARARPMVTEVEPPTTFYPAEGYHNNYYANHQDKPYCQLVISPKLAKLRQKFSGLLRAG